MSTACGRGAVGAVALRASRAYEGRAGASARHIKKMGWARLSQSAAPRRGGGRARLRARRGVAIEAKIWTDDGRRRAAELMGLTREVRPKTPRASRGTRAAKARHPRGAPTIRQPPERRLFAREKYPAPSDAASRRVLDAPTSAPPRTGGRPAASRIPLPRRPAPSTTRARPTTTTSRRTPTPLPGPARVVPCSCFSRLSHHPPRRSFLFPPPLNKRKTQSDLRERAAGSLGREDAEARVPPPVPPVPPGHRARGRRRAGKVQGDPGGVPRPERRGRGERRAPG